MVVDMPIIFSRSYGCGHAHNFVLLLYASLFAQTLDVVLFFCSFFQFECFVNQMHPPSNL